jgi:hypothetical protein
MVPPVPPAGGVLLVEVQAFAPNGEVRRAVFQYRPEFVAAPVWGAWATGLVCVCIAVTGGILVRRRAAKLA